MEEKDNQKKNMKLCVIVLSVSGLIGGVETILDFNVSGAAKPEIAYSQSASLAVPSTAPFDPSQAVGEALADAKGRDRSIAQLFQPHEDQ
jgi:hypothetical protein